MDKGIIKKFDKAIEANEGLEPVLSFYRDVLKEQIKVANKVEEPKEIPSAKEVKDSLLKGEPLIKNWSAPLNPNQVEKLFYKLIEILLKHRSEKSAELAKIKEIPWDFSKLGETFANEDLAPILEQAEKEGVDQSLFSFLFINSLRPFYISYAEATRHLINDSDWTRPHCPVCGQLGQIAKLEGEGGKRYLYCSLCDTTWLYKRLECPYCGAGHEQLRYLDVEDSNYQIDVCDNCKGYIKTLDARELSSQPYMFLEDLLTIHLDLLAQKEGFSKDPAKTKQ
ncbi:MAG: formate dehydrogenase accessory protein FdhE [Firmicutes bacterium]|nr:formate dehydrogenase accessory protein FdhE [Bacillota bacterium]